MKPQDLANQILQILDEADANTAHTAVKIAELLLIHRDHEQLDFDRHLLNDEQQ